ncbi:hypothetical protein SDC9_56682 [bioreactor metagenome]|uniref:Uncharacterized protein n=1 Tax=bioreactor metagenome TaxID=1076179 RepID=A0A644X385_9ZZZZ
MPGVDFLNIDKHHHVVHARFLNKRQELGYLQLVVETGVAAETEAVAERVGHETVLLNGD